MGCILGGADDNQIEMAKKYGKNIGIAFQVVDDILDIVSTDEELGKPVGSDEENHKTTYYTLLEQSGCEELITVCTARAKAVVSTAYEDSEVLCALADWLAGRMN